MSHRLVASKPIISNGKTIWLVLLGAMLILAGVTFKSCRHSKGSGSSCGSAPTAPITSYPRDSAPPLHFNGARSVTVELADGIWSREIITPTESRDYRIDVNHDAVYVLFKDGHVAALKKGQVEYSDFGIRRGIFRILGTTVGQKVTVSY
ncbi:MAG: hypothetical protein Q8O87_02795 [bacterium]|nr:hypothetical protein [bacterium]